MGGMFSLLTEPDNSSNMSDIDSGVSVAMSEEINKVTTESHGSGCEDIGEEDAKDSDQIGKCISSLNATLSEEFRCTAMYLLEELTAQRQDLRLFYENLLEVQEEKWQLMYHELEKQIEALQVDNKHMETASRYREIKKCRCCKGEVLLDLPPPKKDCETQTSPAVLDTHSSAPKHEKHKLSLKDVHEPVTNLSNDDRSEHTSATKIDSVTEEASMDLTNVPSLPRETKSKSSESSEASGGLVQNDGCHTGTLGTKPCLSGLLNVKLNAESFKSKKLEDGESITKFSSIEKCAVQPRARSSGELGSTNVWSNLGCSQNIFSGITSSPESEFFSERDPKERLDRCLNTISVKSFEVAVIDAQEAVADHLNDSNTTREPCYPNIISHLMAVKCRDSTIQCKTKESATQTLGIEHFVWKPTETIAKNPFAKPLAFLAIT